MMSRAWHVENYSARIRFLRYSVIHARNCERVFKRVKEKENVFLVPSLSPGFISSHMVYLPYMANTKARIKSEPFPTLCSVRDEDRIRQFMNGMGQFFKDN